MSLRDRVARLEQEDGGEFLIIHVTGGVPGYSVTAEQEATEIARARAAGKRFVVIGGIGGLAP